MERKARCYVWVDASDCDPPHGLDLESEHDAIKVKHLEDAFASNGFSLDAPALVGYVLEGRIQLLSGTHRHLAAQRTNTRLPVTLWLRSDVEEMWGTELWANVIKDISVHELEALSIKEGPQRSPYDAVNLAELDY